jgi:hypothetical protein
MMSTMLVQVPLDDPEAFKAAVAEGIFDAHRREGYVRTDDDSDEELIDKPVLHEAIYRVLRENAVVRTAKQRSEVALTKGELAKRVFPSAPGAHDEWDNLTLVQRTVWENLVVTAWNPTNPNYSGPVQRIVGDRDDKLVLIRTRTTINGTPRQEAVYLTAVEELIFDDFVDPLKDSVRKAAERLANNGALVSQRNKQLAQKVSREVDSGMRAAASLAKSTLELRSGSTGPSNGSGESS